MQALTPLEQAQSLRAARAELAGILIQDAQRATNSLATRYSCAFDAFYLYALCAFGAPDGLQDHPYRSFLTRGAELLGFSEAEMEWLNLRMDAPYGPLEATQAEVAHLIEAAQDAQKRFGQYTGNT
jgi:hypothetical protein